MTRLWKEQRRRLAKESTARAKVRFGSIKEDHMILARSKSSTTCEMDDTPRTEAVCLFVQIIKKAHVRSGVRDARKACTNALSAWILDMVQIVLQPALHKHQQVRSRTRTTHTPLEVAVVEAEAEVEREEGKEARNEKLRRRSRRTRSPGKVMGPMSAQIRLSY